MARRNLTQAEIEREVERIMRGEDSDPDDFEDDGSDFEDDNLLRESESSENENEDDTVTESNVVAMEVETTRAAAEDTERVEGKSSYIIKPSKTSLIGKNGHKWSSEIPAQSKRTAARNIIHFVPGAKGAAKNCSTFDEYFAHFFTDKILDIVLQYTNAEISIQSQKYHSNYNVSLTTKSEIKALFAILIRSAANKDNHLSAKYMFDRKVSGTFYKACMSRERFIFLMNCLRFDSRDTRNERKQSDSFTHIREIWEIFIEICRSSYTPSTYLTIDEQLVGFRGRCPFRIYIPNKPAKYGIKIVMLCDSSSKYMIDASPYLGKGTNTNGLPLATHFVRELTKSVQGSNRNITMDNWFTSIPLADELLKEPYNLTIIGTLRKNKAEIPQEFLNVKQRNPNTSIFCYDRKKTMVSYMPKKNKVVLLLSTMHENAELATNGKPEIIVHYNQTKGGVDTFDQMCSSMCCNRKTRRWPMVIFYDMINIACINSYIIYTTNTLKLNKKPMNRYQYMIELSNCLADSWLRERLKIKTLRRDIRTDIASILNLPEETETADYLEKKRKTCFYCPSRKRRMTSTYCDQCKNAICGEHRGNICRECAKKIYK